MHRRCLLTQMTGLRFREVHRWDPPQSRSRCSRGIPYVCPCWVGVGWDFSRTSKWWACDDSACVLLWWVFNPKLWLRALTTCMARFHSTINYIWGLGHANAHVIHAQLLETRSTSSWAGADIWPFLPYCCRRGMGGWARKLSKDEEFIESCLVK